MAKSDSKTGTQRAGAKAISSMMCWEVSRSFLGRKLKSAKSAEQGTGETSAVWITKSPGKQRNQYNNDPLDYEQKCEIVYPKTSKKWGKKWGNYQFQKEY